MGSEQSQPQSSSVSNVNELRRNVAGNKLQRGNTIAVPAKCYPDESPPHRSDSRPVSPPISVCSDSDLPYISYTDRPIGDSPKIRNKSYVRSRNVRSNSVSSTSSRKPVVKQKQRPVSSAHSIVVVKSAAKDPGIEKDPEILKLQNIPMFLPVMRGTLSLPSNRDPEILERLQPAHLQNIGSRMQTHYNVCASQVAADQGQLIIKIKEIDQNISKLFAAYVEKQRAYAAYSKQFSKIQLISQQLSRCNTLLNQNLESLETLNNELDIDNRLEPFVWKTD